MSASQSVTKASAAGAVGAGEAKAAANGSADSGEVRSVSVSVSGRGLPEVLYTERQHQLDAMIVCFEKDAKRNKWLYRAQSEVM